MVNISIYWTIVLIAKYIGAAALILLSGTHTHTTLDWAGMRVTASSTLTLAPATKEVTLVSIFCDG